jgi:intracellular septation protein
MSLLRDFLPLAGFLAAFGLTGQAPETAADVFNRYGAAWLGSGAVAPSLAPLLLGCAVALPLTAAHMVWLGLSRRPVGATLLLNGLPILVVSGASQWFSPETFSRWQPSVLCWTLGLAIWLAQVLAGRNVLRSLLAGWPALPDRTWHRLNFAWVAFFGAMGLVHLWAAYSLGVSDWNDFKHYGGLVLAALFALGQAGLLGLRWLRPRLTREHPQ